MCGVEGMSLNYHHMKQDGAVFTRIMEQEVLLCECAMYASEAGSGSSQGQRLWQCGEQGLQQNVKKHSS